MNNDFVWVLDESNIEGSAYICVFTEKEYAENFIELFYGDIKENISLEKVRFNPHIDKIKNGIFPWIVRMNIDGRVEFALLRDIDPGASEWQWVMNNDYCDILKFDSFIYAKNKEEAISIANEELIKAIEDGKWELFIDKKIRAIEQSRIYSYLDSVGYSVSIKIISELEKYKTILGGYYDIICQQKHNG